MRDVVRDFCANCIDEATVRRLMDTPLGWDRDLWKRLAMEIGAFGVAVPEQAGGLGLGFETQAILFEEFGAALVPGPVIGTLGLAIPILAGLQETETAKTLLRDLLEARKTAALTVPLDSISTATIGELPEATANDGGWSLHGTVAHVIDGDKADVFLALARQGDEIALFSVDAGTAGVAIETLSCLDQTRGQADIKFSGANGQLLARGDLAQNLCDRALAIGAAMLAAEQVGAANRILDMTIDYLKTRIQFGKQLGTFQALKHKVADLYVALDLARSTMLYVAWSIDNNITVPPAIISLAKATCSDAFQRITSSAIQLHGGIGFTWEHPLHLYFKRAVADAVTFGSSASHRDRIATYILGSNPPPHVHAKAP